jgi:AcrR family transcriptional regulator
MSPRPRAGEASNTKQKILDAAIALFAKRGFHEASMRDIAARVGVEAASLYAHFESKDAILRAILAEHRQQVAKLRLSDEAIASIVDQHSLETILVGGFTAIQKGTSAPRTEKILRLLFNEMHRNPVVGRFVVDLSGETNQRELARIFTVVRRRGKMRALDPDFAAVLYNALINEHYRELFSLKACGRNTGALEAKTLARFSELARLLSGPG